MIKRVLATVAVTGMLFVVPAVAFAASPYPAPDQTLKCSTAQAPPSTTFTCTITGTNGDAAQLQTTFDGADAAIAGTVTSSPRTIAGGKATFTVTAPAIPGTIGISGIINQVTFDSASVDVADELSSTGFDGMPIAVGAAVLLVAGAGIIVVGARRRSRERQNDTV